MAGLRGALGTLEADAVSFDSMVDLSALVADDLPWRVMGNVNAFALERSPVDRIERGSRRLAAAGVRLIAPACGVVPTTPVAHLRAMRRGCAQASDGSGSETLPDSRRDGGAT